MLVRHCNCFPHAVLLNYRIDPSELARRCQVAVSGSATVRGYAGSTGGQMEVMVQGPHAGFLSKLMSETYGIPRENKIHTWLV